MDPQTCQNKRTS